MGPDSFEKWISTYIKAQDKSEKMTENHPDFWAIEKFITEVFDNPELCWKAILEILNQKPNEKVIGMLSAGPLEDLIHHHGKDFIDRIEKEARENPQFRHLLGGVWESSTPEIWKRIETARVNSW